MSTDEPYRSDDAWHIPKAVTVALVGALCSAAIVGGGWLFSYASQAKDVELTMARVTVLEAQRDKVSEAISTIDKRLVRMETKVDFLVDEAKANQTPIKRP